MVQDRGRNRSRWGAIAAGAVLVDGAPRPKSYRLAGGERVVVDLAPVRAVPPDREYTLERFGR